MFETRRQAGELLGAALKRYGESRPIVYALVRGGLPVAAAAAEQISAPLDIVLVRKLGAPFHQELAIGAIADCGVSASVLHADRIRDLGVSEEFIAKAEDEARQELGRRRAVYFKEHEAIPPAGRTAILVDDGLATGATMEAAVKAVRAAGAKRVVVAAPVAPPEAVERFRRIADDVVCLETPSPFWAVGNHYRTFPQLADSEVVAILAEFDRRGREPGGDRPLREASKQ
jgi:predicted phosphoribosyltransferase